MMLSVQKTRKRLYRLINPVLNSFAFHEKYAVYAGCDMKEAMDICAANFDLTMAYIHAIASHLFDADFAATASQAVPPEIIFTAYLIYWNVAHTLAAMNQDEKIPVPESDSEFLIYIFRSFLEDFSEDPSE